LAKVNGTIFFAANDGKKGFELWKTDGTPGNVKLVKDINPGAGSSMPDKLTNVNGMLFFSADNGSAGCELWKSNGPQPAQC
jgi:ELWxxDGT repeat protein